MKEVLHKRVHIVIPYIWGLRIDWTELCWEQSEQCPLGTAVVSEISGLGDDPYLDRGLDYMV